MTRTLICLGHRGAAGHQPENTLISVEEAITLGADWVEVDVHSVEGELVVIHDDRLERTTNGVGFVADKSLTYLRSLNAGGGQQIPTLPEVFDLVGSRAGINIELKGTNTVPLVTALVERYVAQQEWRIEQFLVSSFDHGALRRAKATMPDLPIGVLVYRNPSHYTDFAQELQARSLHPSIDFIDQATVDDAHARGLQVYVYTVNHPEDISRMAALGVDGVFTDYPDRVLGLSH